MQNEIDPSKVVWEKDYIDPTKVVWEKSGPIGKPKGQDSSVYLPNTEAFHKGFSGDPLAAFEPQERQRMESVLSTFDNPDEEAKKHVITQYLAPRVGMSPEETFNSFQTVADTYFKEKNIGVEKAYKAIGDLFKFEDIKQQTGQNLTPKPLIRWATPEDLNKKPSGVSGAGANLVSAIADPANDKTVAGQLANSVTRGTSNLVTGAIAYPDMLARQTTDVVNGVFWNLPVTLAGKPEWQLWYNESIAGTQSNPLKAAADGAAILQNTVESNLYKENIQGDLLNNLKSGNYANAGKIVAYGIAENVPQFAGLVISNNPTLLGAKLQSLSQSQRVETLSNMWLTLMGASAAGSKRIQLEDKPGDAALKDFNATMTGVFEVATEKMFALPIVEKMFKGNPEGKQSAMKACAETIMDIFKAGSGETASQLGENVTDINTGLGSQPWHSGLLESFVIGGILEGSPAAVNLYRAVTSAPKMSYYEYDQLQAEIKTNVINPRRQELLNKLNLTDAEVSELRRMDSMNANDVIGEMLINTFEPEAPAGKTLQQLQTEGLREFMQSSPERSARFAHDPEITFTAVNEQAAAFPGVNIVAVENEAALPETIRQQIADSGAAGRARGLFDAASNSVYIMADKVAPADVPVVLMHEAVGHLGLRRAFGPQLDSLLDGVYRDYAKDIIAGNESGRWGFNLTDDTDGANDLQDQQRQAAEEYIARTAESIISGAVRPTWWKGFIARFKEWLRTFPGFKNIRFTDREIEGILALSAKAAGKSTTETQRHGEIKFSLAGEIHSDNFKKWFGDSKAVDEKGNPLVLYHGSRSDFNQFDLTKSGQSSTAAGVGIWFTPIKSFAENFASNIWYGKDANKAYATYLSIKNPKIFETTKKDENAIIEKSNEIKTIENSLKELTNKYGWNAYAKREITSDERKVFAGDKPTSEVDKSIYDARDLYLSLIDKMAKAENDLSKLKYVDSYEKFKIDLYVSGGQSANDANVGGLGMSLNNSSEVIKKYRNSLIKDGYDGIIIKQTSYDSDIAGQKNNDQYVVFRPEQIKSATSNNGQFDGSNPDIRFSLAALPGSDIESLGKILLPGVADGSIKSDVDAGEYLKQQGITSLEKHEIQFAYGEARYQLKQINARRKKFEYGNWLASIHPILSGIENKLGAQKIKPDKKFGRQKEISGVYVDWKNGMASDEAAQILGVEESELIDAIKGVKKTELKAEFEQWRKDSSPDAYYQKLADADRAREVEGVIDDVLAGLVPLTDELRAKYPELSDAVYQRITGNDGKAPSDFDWLSAAAQLQQPTPSGEVPPAAPGDAGFMAGFAAGREQAGQEYQDLIAAVKANQDDITAAQKLLKDYAFKTLPKGERDLALKKITQLSEVSNTPTPKFPKGKRQALLEEIFNQMQQQRETLMRSELLERIQERLKQTTVKRGQTGKPIGKYGAEAQKNLDRIREITRLTPGMVYNEQSYWQDMAEAAQNDGGDPSVALSNIAMLETFGVLEGKTAEQLKVALNEIQRLAHDGRMNILKVIESRRMDVEDMRNKMIAEVSGNKGLMSPQQTAVEEHRRAGNKGREALYKYWRQNLNLTWLMNNVTRFSGKALKDTQGGKFVDVEHKAEQREMTGKRIRANAFNAAFDLIFGTSGNVSRGREYVQLRQLVNNSGVFRYQRPSGGTKGLEYSRMTPDEAREMLNAHKEGKARLAEYEVECLRHQLDDIDAGEKYKSSQQQTTEDEIMQQIAKENSERMVVLPKIKEPGVLTEQPLTQGEAAHLWLCWQQPNVRYKMQFNGWTNDSIKQLESFLRPEARKLGEWMRDELEKDFPAVNETFRKQYYTDMPHSPNYFPTSYNVRGGISDNTKAAFGMPFGMASVSPGALKSRRFHLLEPAARDAFATYAAHVVQMEHFKAISENINDMRAVFNNTDVKNAIIQYRGEQAYNDLVATVTTVADGGRRDAAKISFISGMYSPWVASKLMINFQSATKQLAGVFAYMNSIPAAPFAKGCAAFWTAPVDNARMLMNTDYFKNRWSGAMDRDLNMLLDWSSSVAGKNSGWMHELVQNGSILNKAGDALSVVVGGYSVYKYHYDNLIKRGVQPDAAHEQAIIEWEKASDSTQQSGAVKDMNYYQMGGTIERMMTTYLSNPILVMQAQTETLFDTLAGRESGNAAKFGRMVMINHIIVPSLMTGIVQMIKHGAEWDDYELEDFLIASILGPFNSLFMLGKGLDSIVPLLMGKYQRAASTFPVIDDISHAFSQGKKIAEGNADLDVQEVLTTIANTGAALTPFSNTAAVVGAAGRESRRWWNFFTGDGDKKAKRNRGTGLANSQ